MKEPEMILGYAEYGDGKCPFVYKDGTLNLLPSTEKDWNQQKGYLWDELEKMNGSVKHEWISNAYIKGITNQGNNILFISKGSSSNNNGFKQYQIQVIYEYDSSVTNGELIEGLSITADEIDYFFNPSRVFEPKITFQGNSLQEIIVKTGKYLSKTVDLGAYTKGNVTVNVEVSAHSTFTARSQTPLSAKSQMYFEFNQALNIDETVEVINQQISFLKYISYRQNVNLKTIHVFKRNGKGLRNKEGQIYIISENLSEKNKKKTERILTLELLEQNIIPIFQAIANDKIYFSHICKSIDDQSSYTVARIILLFAAFEREYNNIFSSNPMRSERYLKTKSQVLGLLDEYKKTCENKKMRKDVEGFKKGIEKSDTSLRARLKNAADRCKDIIGIFLSYKYQVVNEDLIDEIADRMRDIRNDIAHGNLDLTIEPIHLSDLNILEILIYVMRMKSLNMSVKGIQRSICQLFGFNLYIPDE